jgi:hypothetical protein
VFSIFCRGGIEVALSVVGTRQHGWLVIKGGEVEKVIMCLGGEGGSEKTIDVDYDSVAHGTLLCPGLMVAEGLLKDHLTAPVWKERMQAAQEVNEEWQVVMDLSTNGVNAVTLMALQVAEVVEAVRKGCLFATA